LQENFPTVYARNFDEISLAGLIRVERVRDLLVSAEQAMQKGDYKKSMENVALAFRLALSEYLFGQQSGEGPRRLFHPGSEALPSFFSHALSDLGSTGTKITEALGRMSSEFGEAITVIAYNLDFDGYRYLKTYSPVIHEFIGGKTSIEWPNRAQGIDEEIVKRCLAFVTDAALRLEGEYRDQKFAGNHQLASLKGS
jgi:hypothetical protein